MEGRIVKGGEVGAKKQNANSLVYLFGTLALLGSVGVYFLVPELSRTVYQAEQLPLEKLKVEKNATTTSTDEENVGREVMEGSVPQYLPTPDSLKAIYMTQCVVGTPSFRTELVNLIDETELNSVVIDIKDYSGKISFDTNNPDLVESVSDKCGARDMVSFIELLHSKGIYVIGRITVFQDPYYSLKHPELAVKFASPEGAVWKDGKGLSFIDVGAKPYWDYIIILSREARKIGFDELNYDYIRFPSDGPMQNITFDWAGNKEKQVALEEFFAYLQKEMKDSTKYPQGVTPPIISADLFGMVTTNYDDLNIGQVLESALPYFDYIAPMVYPSHYPKGFNGWNNPNTVPYELIKFVLSSAVSRTVAQTSSVKTLDSQPVMKSVEVPPTASTSATTTKQVATGMYTKEVYDKNKIRPWLQDFDYGGNYDVSEVKAQIQATYDVGLDSWMLWAPSNKYTQGALKDE